MKKRKNQKNKFLKDAHDKYVASLGFNKITKERKQKRKQEFWKKYSDTLKENCQEIEKAKVDKWDSKVTAKKSYLY